MKNGKTILLFLLFPKKTIRNILREYILYFYCLSTLCYDRI